MMTWNAICALLSTAVMDRSWRVMEGHGQGEFLDFCMLKAKLPLTASDCLSGHLLVDNECGFVLNQLPALLEWPTAGFPKMVRVVKVMRVVRDP